MTVANCSKCRRIFQRTTGSLCPACRQDAMSHVSQAYRFIQGNPRMTLEDVAENCRIPLKELEDMFFSGKLGTAAGKVIYHCPRCSREIAASARQGRFCAHCSEKIESEVGLHQPSAPKTERAAKRPETERPPEPDTSYPMRPIEAAGTDHWPHDTDEPESLNPLGGVESYGFKRMGER